jgi:hypothetical protein
MTNPSTAASSPSSVVDPNDAVKPIVAEKRINFTFSGDALDKTKANWKTWSAHIRDDLDMSGLGTHIKDPSKYPPPNDTVHPTAFRNWETNDCAARAYINRNCAQVERDLLEDIVSARKCWETLEALHLAEGPVRQANLIQGALATRIPRDKDQVTIARKVREDIRRAFRMPGGISEETLVNIAFLMALGPGHEHTRAIIQRDMQAATKDKPFDSERALDYLEQDLQLLLGDQNRPQSTSIALAAVNHNQTHGKAQLCSNCKKPRHIARYCIQEGGGMAGKSIAESKAQKQADYEAERGKKFGGGGAKTVNASHQAAPGKIAVTGIDKHRNAFMVYVDPPTEDIVAFAGLPSINVDSPSFNPDDFEVILSTEALEDAAMSAISLNIRDAYINAQIPLLEDAVAASTSYPPDPSTLWQPATLKATVDWNTQVRTIDAANISTNALNQTKRTPLSFERSPFYADSGATCHITPERDDFVTLRPIHDRRV